MSDLFQKPIAKKQATTNETYTAEHIEVLEGLEPVRHRPGMYIGGTDESALHHLVSEVFDNAMDEAVAGYADTITLQLHEDQSVTVTDNGRGIPIDPHPKYPDKSALEVILTTLHAGGKFNNKVYETSGGLHGVGISVVNALSDTLDVNVRRNGEIWHQRFSKGAVVSPLEKIDSIGKKHTGTHITFHPDFEIFDEDVRFKPQRLYQLAKSKAYLYKGVKIQWKCDASLLTGKLKVPEEEVLHFPKGLEDYLKATVKEADVVATKPFAGEVVFDDKQGRAEWAVHWVYLRDSKLHSYCNTVPTPQGGSHETGVRNALLKGLKHFAEVTGNKKATNMSVEDVCGNVEGILSLFIPNPQFQGQTKDKLSNRNVIRLVENAVKDHFDQWLSANKSEATELLEFILERMDERLNRRQQREITRKSPTQRLRLPGKLADCSDQTSDNTEIFLVEGDSAGGSAKMARDRKTQAILPLRGKILNVASATRDKIHANQEISDMLLALGCGTGDQYRESDLRYNKVIIMTDADVDGAHIAALLMTFFHQCMSGLIYDGHLYLAQPPLFRISNGKETLYANSQEEKEALVQQLEAKRAGRVDVGRFKGLGEMTPSQLKETTMMSATRQLLQIRIDEEKRSLAAVRVNELMGKKPELRYQFIVEQSQLMGEEIKESLDI